MMEIVLIDGKKGNGDKVILIKTNGFHALTYEDLFKLVKLQYMNEDKIYPPPFKGKEYLVNALLDLRDHSVEEVLKKYKLWVPQKLHDFLS
jgi:hypothetical protein